MSLRRLLWLLPPVAIAACDVFPETSPEALVHNGLEAGTDGSVDANGGAAGTAGTGAMAGASGSAGLGGVAGSSGDAGGGTGGDAAATDASESGADAPDAIETGDAEPDDAADGADADGVDAKESGTTVTITAKLGGGSDDVNEDGAVFTDNATTTWLGNATQKHNSYTGLRFGPIAIPSNATIVFAHLRVAAAADSSTTLTFNYGAEAADDCGAFQASSPPSSRSLTNASVAHGTDSAWMKNGVYTLDEITSVVQEVVSRSGWTSGNHLCVITKGGGSPNLTRTFFSVEGSAPQAAVLLIRYTSP